MADNCSITSSASSATTTGLSTKSCRGRSQDASRKQKQELRRERAKKAISLKTDDVTEERIPDKDSICKTDTIQEPVNVIKDTLIYKYENGINKVTKLKDQELNKLRQDLARCQLELREEVEKRGHSSSVRSGFEHERRRLLGELRDAGEAKRRLELALEAASNNIKRKTGEIREMQEAGKQKLAALEKSANNEIRKLLDELKNRDQLIVVLQSTDKSTQAKTEILNYTKSLPQKNHHHHSSHQHAREPLESNFDNTEQIYPNLSSNITAQRRMYIMEKQLQQWSTANEYLNKRNKEYEEGILNLEKNVDKLENQNKRLKCDLETIKIEAAKLSEMLSEKNILLIKDQIESLKDKTNEQKLINASIHQDGQSIIKKNRPEKLKHRKTLCFFLPGDTAPTPGGKVPMFVDESTMTESVVFLNDSAELRTPNNSEKTAESKMHENEFDENVDIQESNHQIVINSDPLMIECNEREDDYDDERMEEDHLQMEASFELMMQQEMMHQEQVQQELMQQEILQQIQMRWEEEKERMCAELIKLKDKLKLKTESDEFSKKKKVPTATLR